MATALIRTILLYLILMVGLRAMGKRQIGELEPIELVLTLLISDLASVPMQVAGTVKLSPEDAAQLYTLLYRFLDAEGEA